MTSLESQGLDFVTFWPTVVLEDPLKHTKAEKKTKGEEGIEKNVHSTSIKFIIVYSDVNIYVYLSQ